MRPFKAAVLILLSTVAGPGPSAHAPARAPFPAGFVESVYVSDISIGTSTAMEFTPDGALFYCEQSGGVRIIRGGAILPQPFLTLGNVYNNGTLGLLGIAFDPEFVWNRFVFLYYTEDPSRDAVVARFRASSANPDVAEPGPGIEIVRVPYPGGQYDRPIARHVGGALHFGTDGMLYVGVGDRLMDGTAGAPDGVQNLGTLYGKILRIDRNGMIPWDNPFVNTPGARGEIWAYGFRQPFTFAVQPGTGRLFVNDVGTGPNENDGIPGDAEELNDVVKGGNYGWPQVEGPSGSPGLINPLHSYRLSDLGFGKAITGGTFYNPPTVQFPGSYVGQYFFSEWGTGQIFIVDPATGATREFGSVANNGGPIDLDVGPDGALYYLRAWPDRSVGRIAYTGTTPQNLVVSPASLTATEGGAATFTVRLAVDPAGPVTASVVRTSGSPDVTVSPATLDFDSGNWSVPQTITVSAAEDADSQNEGATVTCSSPGLASRDVVVTVLDNDTSGPVVRISLPNNGDTLSGTQAEFYGGSNMDGQTVRGEFYVDGVLEYTDFGPGHYHVGGDHGAWNTTRHANGPHTLRLVIYDAQGGSGSHEITVTISNPVSGGVFQQDGGPDGVVSIEAENFGARVAQGGHAWEAETGFGGSALRALPDTGTLNNAGYAASSPRLDFPVNFVKTGTHYVWVRGLGPAGTGDNDSVHVGLNGAETASADRIAFFGSSWTWSADTMDGVVATLEVPSPGVHTVNVWMREDGFVFDKLLLTVNAAYPAPTGAGPPESPRTGGGGGPPPAAGGGKDKNGCGATGLEALLVLVLPVIFRKCRGLALLLVAAAFVCAATPQAANDPVKSIKAAKAPREKASAIRALANVEAKDRSMIAALAPCLNLTPTDPEALVPIAAIDALGGFRGELAAARLLMEAMKRYEKSVVVLRRIFAAIGRVGHESAVPALEDYVLRSTHPETAVVAIDALGDMPPGPGIEALFRISEKMPVTTELIVNPIPKQYAHPRILQVLSRITGAAGGSVSEYRSWWAKHGTDFRKKGPPVPRPPAPSAATEPLVRFTFNEMDATQAFNEGVSSPLHPVGKHDGAVGCWDWVAPKGGINAAFWGVESGEYRPTATIDVDGIIEHLKNLKSFTILGWLCRCSTDEAPGGPRILSWLNPGRDGVELVLRADGSLQLGVNQWAQASSARSAPRQIPTVSGPGPNAFVANYHFFAVTYDSTLVSGNVKFYVSPRTGDPQLKTTTDYTRGSVGSRIAPLSIGNASPAARAMVKNGAFHGGIDELHVFGSTADGAGALALPHIVAVKESGAPSRY